MASIEVVKHSEHGLGQYLSPTGSRGWMKEFWGWVIENELGRSPPEPSWFRYPLTSKLAASSPALLKPLEPLRGRPFSFMQTAYVREFGNPVGTKPEDFRIVAPFEPDPSRWLAGNWRNARTGEPVRVTTETFQFVEPDEVRLKTYGDLAAEYGHRPEVIAAGPDGLPCEPGTVGQLGRLDVYVPQKDWIGKEANNLELLDAGLVTSPGEICQPLGMSRRTPDWVLEVMRSHTAKELSDRLDLSIRYVRDLRNRKREPSPELLERLVAWAATASPT